MSRACEVCFKRAATRDGVCDVCHAVPTCEHCGNVRANCGPFRDDTRTWKSLCGSCKIRIALSGERKVKLANELSLGCSEMLGEKASVTFADDEETQHILECIERGEEP